MNCYLMGDEEKNLEKNDSFSIYPMSCWEQILISVSMWGSWWLCLFSLCGLVNVFFTFWITTSMLLLVWLVHLAQFLWINFLNCIEIFHILSFEFMKAYLSSDLCTGMLLHWSEIKKIMMHCIIGHWFFR